MNQRTFDGALLFLAGASIAATAAVGWAATTADASPPFWSWLAPLVVLATAAGWRASRSAVRERHLREQLELSTLRERDLRIEHMRFVERIAHEIKTPLTLVLNQAELLKRCSTDALAVRARAEELADYTLHYSRLVEGFLRLGGPCAAPDASHHQPVHVHDTVLGAVRGVESTALSRGVRITVSFPDPCTAEGVDDASPEVLGEEHLLLALIESLVGHAVRGSPRGGLVEVRLAVADDRIVLRVRAPDLAPRTDIVDAVLDNYFAAAVPGHQQDAEAGFATCRRIAQHHRGSLHTSTPAGGVCEFVLALPRWREGAPVLVGDTPARTPPPHAGAAGTRSGAEPGEPS